MRIGMDAYEQELNEKVGILETLLTEYDDGRRKSFFCLAVNLLELQEIKIVMERLANDITADALTKERAVAATSVFEEMAGQRSISLKLRKKAKIKGEDKCST
jgi:hypothetical protein